MWLFTKRGFYSIAASQTPGAPEGTISVRGRVKADLEAFREHYSAKLGPTMALAGTDYEYRADISPVDLAAALVKMVPEIDYTKFKPAAAEFSSGGHARHDLYIGVWSAMYVGGPFGIERYLKNAERDRARVDRELFGQRRAARRSPRGPGGAAR